jgi:hypothetical protein
MGAARKLVEKAEELLRALGLYRRKEGEEVRAELRKKGRWVGHMPLSWTLDIHRIADGRAQIGLLLRIFAHTMGAPHAEKEDPPVWTPGLVADDWAKELDISRNAAQDAIDGAIARGLIARQSEDPKAKGRAYYKLRLLPENWAAIVDPITPKKPPARAETSSEEEAPPRAETSLHHVQPGRPIEFFAEHRYEFPPEIPVVAIENYLDVPGKIVLNAAGVLRLDPIKPRAAVVNMPVSEDASVENKGEKTASRLSPPKRDGKLKPADVPLTAAAIRAAGFTYAANFMGELWDRTREAVRLTGGSEDLVEDRIVSWGIAACKLEKQRSAALFWDTVPSWVAAHLHDKEPPGKRKTAEEQFVEDMLKPLPGR